MQKFRRKAVHHTKRRGSIIVLALVCLVIVVAFLAFSVDFGYIVVADSELQNAADAGAMSGARALPESRAAAITAAKTWASKNIAAGESVVVTDEDVEIGLWNDDTAAFTVLPADSAESPNAVRVTCHRSTARGNPLNLFFAPAIGTNSADLTVTATAKIERGNCGMFVGTQYVDVQNATVDSYDSSAGGYDSSSAQDNGDVCSDGPITLSPQGVVNGDARPGEGYSVSDPTQVTGRTEPRDNPIRWSPVETLGPSETNNNDAIPAWALTNEGKRLVVESSSILELAPGTYYLPEGLRTAGSGRINITGPTKLILGGAVTVEGTGLVNQTTAPANLRIEMVSASARLAGSATLFADIYAPTTQLTVATNDAGAFHGAIFAESIVMEGSGASLHGDESLRKTFDEYTSRVSLKQ